VKWPAFLFFLLCAVPAFGQVTRYELKLIPDLERHILRGEETIALEHSAGDVQWQKQAGMKVTKAGSADGEMTLKNEAVTAHFTGNGAHRVSLQYTARTGRGITWFLKAPGFDAAFYCEGWMVCDNSPGQRATLRLEIVIPVDSKLTAVGPGQFEKSWKDGEGEHFVFEQNNPVQTYLFSFAVAKLRRLADGKFVIYAADQHSHTTAFARTAEAYAFFRRKSGLDLDVDTYTQAVMAEPTGQEAAAMTLMPPEFLGDVEEKDDADLLAHELAHQWWGVLVGIRSWSDFWLNEGMADFMTDAFLEQRKGRAAYDRKIADTQKRLEKLRATGRDRPLHWDGWKDAQEALGPIPYVKGALFLDRLRTELGEGKFWKGLALYTARSAHQLVEANDFQRAMEEASARDLTVVFDEGVYH